MELQAYNPQCQDRDAGLFYCLRRNPSLVELKLRRGLGDCAGTIQATGDLCFMAKIIELTRGQIALVDECDFERVNQFEWHASLCRGKWYAQRARSKAERKLTGLPRLQRMHHFIGALLSLTPPVDHRDCNGLNNTRTNLRSATNSQNGINTPRPRNNTSGFKGVHRSHHGRWAAVIKQNYKSIHLGYFKTPELAARAYDAKARELFGEFAWLNFPEKEQPNE